MFVGSRLVGVSDFKTSHFQERKTAPLDRGEIGSMGHVECPQSEPHSPLTECAGSSDRIFKFAHLPGLLVVDQAIHVGFIHLFRSGSKYSNE
jgi:hypothetical protein